MGHQLGAWVAGVGVVVAGEFASRCMRKIIRINDFFFYNILIEYSVK
jgi:hypothetical protein